MVQIHEFLALNCLDNTFLIWLFLLLYKVDLFLFPKIIRYLHPFYQTPFFDSYQQNVNLQ